MTTNSAQTPSLDDLTRSLTPVVLGGPALRRTGEHRTRRPLLRRSGSRVARGTGTVLPSDLDRPVTLR
jgi:hypothetical protein